MLQKMAYRVHTSLSNIRIVRQIPGSIEKRGAGEKSTISPEFEMLSVAEWNQACNSRRRQPFLELAQRRCEPPTAPFRPLDPVRQFAAPPCRGAVAQLVGLVAIVDELFLWSNHLFLLLDKFVLELNFICLLADKIALAYDLLFFSQAEASVWISSRSGSISAATSDGYLRTVRGLTFPI